MIFVAVGTTEFADLIRTMDELSLQLEEEVIMQIGRSSYEPQHCQYFRYAPSLEPYYKEASVIISHGGLGIVTEVMERGKPLVAVEDPHQPDRHQQQILSVWAKQHHLVWCRDMSHILAAMTEAKQGLIPYQRPESTIHQHIAQYLEHNLKPQPAKPSPANKRVCVIRLSTYIGDMSVQREVATLHQAGFETHVICMDAIEREENYQRETIIDGIYVHRLPTTRKKRGLIRYMYDYLSFFVLASLKVSQLHRQQPFDVIQVNTMPDFLVFTTLLPKIWGAKVVVMMQEPVPELWQTLRLTPAPRPITLTEQAALAYADAAFTVTQQLKEAFVSRGARADKISVILNVPETSFLETFKKEPPPSADNQFRLICHGAIEERYGHDTMLEAIALVKSQIPEIRLRIMGQGSYTEEFRRQIKRLGVQEQVDFLGWVTLAEMVQEIQAADVGIVAQKSSPYSNLVQTNKMYEYIAFGKPVLASRLKAVEAYFGPEAIHYFEPNNPASLAEGILQLYCQPDYRQTLVQNAKKLYDQYHWEKQKQAYLAVFHELMN